MPILGNPVAGGGSLSLTPVDLFGHFANTRFVVLNAVIPTPFIINFGMVYAAGPPGGQPNGNCQLGLYDGTPALPQNWPLVSVSTVITLVTASAGAWRHVPWVSGVLPAGTYGLAVLSNSAGGFTGSIFHTNKLPASPASRTFIAPGVMPNPLGGPPVNGNQEWSLYIDWVAAGGYTPTAACCCQPKC